MPYIITTFDSTRSVYNGETGVSEYESEARTAVATLEEARQDARNLVEDRAQAPGWTPDYIAARETARNLSEPGGTIGPLPDGTVIEVEPMTRFEVIDAAGESRYLVGMTAQEMVAAFNAQR